MAFLAVGIHVLSVLTCGSTYVRFALSGFPGIHSLALFAAGVSFFTMGIHMLSVFTCGSAYMRFIGSRWVLVGSGISRVLCHAGCGKA